MTSEAPTRPTRRGRRWRSALALLLLGIVSVVAWAAVAGIPIDLGSQRPALSRLLSEQAGRPVSLDGELQLRLGLRPHLRVTDARLAQPEGFGEGDFLRVGEIEIRMDLWPLLRGQLRADRLAARGVVLFLRQHEDGRNNWTFAAPEQQAVAEPADADSLKAADVAGIDIRQLDLADIRIFHEDGGPKPFEFHLEQAQAALPIGSGISVRAQGRVEQTMPYQLAIDGGELRELLTGKPGWPLSVQLDFAGGRLVAKGSLGEADSRIDFGLGAPDLARFGKVIGVKLPEAGAAGLTGALSVRPGVVRIDRLSGLLGKSQMAGWLQVDSRGARPAMSGALGVQALDLRPFLGQDSEDDPPADLQALYRSLAKARLDLQALNALDIDLQLGVGQWLSLPGEIRDASLHLKLDGGKLSVPVAATIEGVPMTGRLETDARQPVPALSLAFGAQRAPVGNLARFLFGVPGIDGQLGGLSLTLSAQGVRGDALMRSLAVAMEMKDSRLSYGNGPGGKPVDFTLERMALQVAGTRPLRGKLDGSLLGKPLEATLSGESLLSLLQQGTAPVALTVQTGRIAARVQGVLNGADQSADLTFSLGAERAGDVGAWLGLNPRSNLPIALAGRVRGTMQAWSLSQLVFQVGDSSIYSNLDQKTVDQHQRLSASLEIASVNLKQLDELLPPPKPPQPGQKPSLDIPILPARLVLDDADVRVRARDIRGTQLELGEMGFDGRVRNGFMQSSPFFAEIAGTRYEGAVMLDLREAEPHAQLWLSAAPVDVSRVLRQLKLAKNIDASVDRLSLYIDTRSGKLATMMAHALVAGEVSGGRLLLRDENTQSQLQVALASGVLSARPGERLQLSLDGAVDAIPVAIRLRSATMAELADLQRRLPFELELEAAKTRARLSGSVDRDIDARDVELALTMSGERFDRLDKLLRISLPPWGPWSADGRFRMNASGYAVDGLQLQVGSSTLRGRGSMDTQAGRPKLDIALEAPLVQLDDFKLAGWSALNGKTDGKADSARSASTTQDTEALRRKAVETSEQVQGLLSRELLSRADATLAVRVGQVKSGADMLGRGQLDARLLNGRAEIGPIVVEMPGGQASGQLSYEPRENDVLAALKLDIDRFDYGVIGRRVKSGSDLDGRFSLHVDVNSRAPRLSQILAHGDGRIDVAVWPRELRAGVFDLWAVNLFVALLPTLDPKNESVVNCAVGRFALKGGKLSQEQLVIDTSRMRVTGTASADFGSERIAMRLQPQAKSAQFLSLATPIEVNGNFSDFSVGPNAGDVLQTVLRMATSILWVPLQRLFSDKVPQDGSDVCGAAFR